MSLSRDRDFCRWLVKVCWVAELGKSKGTSVGNGKGARLSEDVGAMMIGKENCYLEHEDQQLPNLSK